MLHGYVRCTTNSNRCGAVRYLESALATLPESPSSLYACAPPTSLKPSRSALCCGGLCHCPSSHFSLFSLIFFVSLLLFRPFLLSTTFCPSSSQLRSLCVVPVTIKRPTRPVFCSHLGLYFTIFALNLTVVYTLLPFIQKPTVTCSPITTRDSCWERIAEVGRKR